MSGQGARPELLGGLTVYMSGPGLAETTELGRPSPLDTVWGHLASGEGTGLHNGFPGGERKAAVMSLGQTGTGGERAHFSSKTRIRGFPEVGSWVGTFSASQGSQGSQLCGLGPCASSSSPARGGPYREGLQEKTRKRSLQAIQNPLTSCPLTCRHSVLYASKEVGTIVVPFYRCERHKEVK